MHGKRGKLSLFLFIDAFGWEVKQRHPDFLQGLVRDSKPLETILGYSSACDPSIISGLTPSEHGLWSSFYYDPPGSPFKWLRPLHRVPSPLLRHSRVRNRLSRWVKNRCEFTGYFQLYSVPLKDIALFNYAEQKRIWEPNGLPHGESIFDRMSRESIPYYTHDSDCSDEMRLEHLLKRIEEQSIDFAYCSLGGLDRLMHEKGNNHPDIARLMKGYDKRLRDLFSVADANYEEINWFLFTDHGMHNVKESYDLKSDIEALGLGWAKDYVAFYDSTMARFWFKNETARTVITECLAHHSRGRILSDTQLRNYGVWFKDGQYGELIFLMESGTQIVPSFMGVKPCRGMHGYDPADPDSYASLSSNRPLPESITKIQDIHRLMLNELGLD